MKVSEAVSTEPPSAQILRLPMMAYRALETCRTISAPRYKRRGVSVFDHSWPPACSYLDYRGAEILCLAALCASRLVSMPTASATFLSNARCSTIKSLNMGKVRVLKQQVCRKFTTYCFIIFACAKSFKTLTQISVFPPTPIVVIQDLVLSQSLHTTSSTDVIHTVVVGQCPHNHRQLTSSTTSLRQVSACTPPRLQTSRSYTLISVHTPSPTCTTYSTRPVVVTSLHFHHRLLTNYCTTF